MNTQDFRELLWFLQTNLNPKEKRYLLEKIYRLNKQSAMLYLENFMHSKEFKEHFLIPFQNFLNLNKTNYELVSFFELNEMINKPLPECFPLALSYQGNLAIIEENIFKVAIIGSRKISETVFFKLEDFIKEISKLPKLVTLSGGAIGVDSVANKSAFENNCPTVVVLGSGLGNYYPSRNKEFFNKLSHSKQALLLSEFSYHDSPRKWNFPMRNQTLALLSDIVLVAQAEKKSGTLITVKNAMEFGIPVAVLSFDNEIFGEGAKELVESFDIKVLNSIRDLEAFLTSTSSK